MKHTHTRRTPIVAAKLIPIFKKNQFSEQTTQRKSKETLANTMLDV